MKTDQILKLFRELPLGDKEHVIELLAKEWDLEEGDFNLVLNEVENLQVKTPSCVHCQSDNTMKRGKQRGVQRYSCKSCGKYWMATHGTSLLRLRKRDLWNKYIQSFDKGLSIRQAAKEVGISIQTCFRWRHRLLSSLNSMVPEHLDGIVEADDFQLSLSEKGKRDLKRKAHRRGRDSKNHDSEKVSVLVSVVRGKNGANGSVIKAKKINGVQVKKALEGKLLSGTTIITDEAKSFKVLKELEHVEHKTVNSKLNQKRKDPIHLQTVNQSHKSIKDFLAPFNGVSTKYLQNYLTWYHFKQNTKMRLDKVKHAFITCLLSTNAMDWWSKLVVHDTVIIT